MLDSGSVSSEKHLPIFCPDAILLGIKYGKGTEDPQFSRCPFTESFCSWPYAHLTASLASGESKAFVQFLKNKKTYAYRRGDHGDLGKGPVT